MLSSAWKPPVIIGWLSIQWQEVYSVHVINAVRSDALRGIYIRQAKNDSRDFCLLPAKARWREVSFHRFRTCFTQNGVHHFRRPSWQHPLFAGYLNFHLANFIAGLLKQIEVSCCLIMLQYGCRPPPAAWP